MGAAKKRKDAQPDISVLIPSRGRPDALARCIASLGNHANVEILVGLDDDDPNPGIFLDREMDVTAKVFTWPRHPTLGALLNHLAAESKGRYLMMLGDDHVIDEPNWSQMVVDGFAALPNEVGVLYPACEHHPGFPSITVISRRAYEAVGYYYPPFFPYWFGDTWWDEMAILVGQKRELPFAVRQPDGKGETHGLIDLPFWLNFFDRTRPMRLKDALTLARNAYPANDPRGQKMFDELNVRQQFCVDRMAHWNNPGMVDAWADKSASPPSARYAEVKAQAEALLVQLGQEHPRPPRVALCVPSGRTWEASTALDVVAVSAYSALAGIDLVALNVQSSMISNSRNQSVKLAIDNGCDYIMWIDSDMRIPPDTIVRLLQHDKDIVGALYNKRVPPYETLGKLIGPKPMDPTELDGGLHEAALMPSGVMLVKTDVYKKIGWPAYFESYMWPGDDGLTAFQNLLRDYFGRPVPESILGSMAETEFGEWLRQNYILGSFGESIQIRSEDFSFCIKARRHSYRLWVDLDLTFVTKHSGSIDVSCEPAKREAKQAAE